MVVERRLSIIVSAAVAFALLTVLWNAFMRPAHRVRAGPAPDAPLVLVPTDSATAARDSAARATSPPPGPAPVAPTRSEEHTSELQSQSNLVCRLLLEKKKRSDVRAIPS